MARYLIKWSNGEKRQKEEAEVVDIILALSLGTSMVAYFIKTYRWS